jgi:hypothetical protein
VTMAASFSSGTGDPGEERLAEAARLPVARRGDPVRIQEADGDPVRPGPSAPGRRRAAAQPARHPRQPHVPVDHRATHESHGARRRRRGCVPPGDSVDAGLRVLGQAAETGWNPDRIAGAWDTLMKRLGYPHHVSQGGDWGARINWDAGLAWRGTSRFGPWTMD